MTNNINIRPLGANQIALDIGNQTHYLRVRDGIIEGRPFGQGHFDRYGYINPSLPSQIVPLSFPPSIFGK